MKNKDFLAAATLLAALAVALGAFGAHGLKQLVLPDKIEVFKTGVQYQLYHAFAIALTVLVSQFIDSPWLRRSAWFFTFGILFFSGSLYLLTYFAATHTGGQLGRCNHTYWRHFVSLRLGIFNNHYFKKII